MATEAYVQVSPDSTGKKVRTIERSINSNTVEMQSVVIHRSGIQNWLTLYAQHLGNDTRTIQYQGKSDEDQSSSTSQAGVLTRRPMPSDLTGVVNSFEDTTTSTSDNTVVINKKRFWFNEKLLETLTLNGTVRWRATLAVKASANTAHLQRVIFSLVKQTAADTYTTIGTKTVTVSVTNATSTYSDFSVVGEIDFSVVTLATNEQLAIEISTDGKIITSGTCTHRLSFDAGTSKTYCEVLVEEN